MAVDLHELHRFAVELAVEAGALLRDASLSLRRPSQSSSSATAAQQKKNAVDLVTSTDHALEHLLRTRIHNRYPSHKFLGEESYEASLPSSERPYLVTGEPTWIVDPLDGTVNHVHQFPLTCISIGFALDGIPVMGVIYAPMLDQLFSGAKGCGAYMNTHCLLRAPTFDSTTSLPLIQPPPPIPPNAPQGCLLAVEWGKDRRLSVDSTLARKIESFQDTPPPILPALRAPGGMVHGIRSLGSAALDMAYVAAGSLDIFWEGGCWEWDVCAGWAILVEAGGLITTCNSPPEGDPDVAEIPEARLGSRLYLAVRPAGDAVSENGSGRETAREGQERCVREVWKRIRGLGYRRDGA
ncbi:hypothetical protein SAICODRAFT_54176 [Saitoella complicata NRRL Y-17804]|uniref:uncharacterized protein n=1 Tax=Saitoella complicata (strain BCRC 22490 / CBS 7301 / JCM 7358 / NBRC 10748 / NRRL Y-17804) TaxID=698492 RepID=UPI00086713F4|nr:uncharacterized protein SAICODRAFT_54176 [Saitoella complicata NRRL Y-17804]ODQ54583.1 hypothetical protein SAICODRAFT_54176 [Saitoella complicata NRRL Y-17804]